MTPSNANTSGLEVVAWRYRLTNAAAGLHRDSRGAPWAYSDESTSELEGQRIVEPLVTAASAQARIAELEQWQASAIRSARIHDENIREFDARADRLAQGMPDLSAVIGWLANGCDTTHAVTELRIYQGRIDHALQQEG